MIIFQYHICLNYSYLKSGGRIAKIILTDLLQHETTIAFQDQIAYTTFQTLRLINLSTLNAEEKDLSISNTRLARNSNKLNEIAIGGYHMEKQHDVILVFDIDRMSILKTLDYPDSDNS